MATRCVCFDLGGVLVRIAHDWEAGCRAAGLPVRGASAGSAAGRIRGEISHRFGLGRISYDEFCEGQAAASDNLYSAEEYRRIHDAWTMQEYEGVFELVNELHQRALATACLSNTNDSHWRRLRHLPGTRALPATPEYPSVLRLQHAHASHLLGLSKPDPEIFRAFERATEFSGEQILYFDDAIANVEAARAVGWRAERVDPRSETVPQLRAILKSYRVLE